MSQDFTHLNNDQRALINIYLSQYTEIGNQINSLLEAQSNIRNTINSLIFNRNTRNNNNYRNNYNSYYNSNSRENRNIFYDYDNPINPLSYVSPIIYNSDTYRSNFSNLLNTFLNSTVSIYPTEQQITNATRLVRYCDINNPITDTCPISLERFGNNDNVRQIHHCGHIFSDNALTEWFRSNVRCPVCRYDIRNYVVNTTNNNTSSINTNDNTNNDNINRTHSEDSLEDSNETTSAPTTQPVNINERQSSTNNTNISNVNFVRNPISNTIDQVEFDIENDELVNTLLSYATNLVRSSNTTLTNNSNNSNIRNTNSSRNSTGQNQRVAYDPSLNVLLFETFLRPSRR